MRTRPRPRVVPPHLGYAYPVDLTVWLLSCALVLSPSAIATTPTHISRAVQVGAGMTVVVLLLGWWLDDRRLTGAGSYIAAGTWVAQLATYLASGCDMSRRWWAIALVYAAGVNLTLGMWAIIQRTPTDRRSSRWLAGRLPRTDDARADGDRRARRPGRRGNTPAAGLPVAQGKALPGGRPVHKPRRDDDRR